MFFLVRSDVDSPRWLELEVSVWLDELQVFTKKEKP